MTSKSALRADDLSLKTALLSCVGITAVVGVFILLAIFFNKARREKVIHDYTQETLKLVSQNSAATKAFFVDTFDSCARQLQQLPLTVEQQKNPPSDFVCQSAKEALAQLKVDTLRDSSAIAYMRIQGDNYELIEASGKYNKARNLDDQYSYAHFRSPDNRKSLSAYVHGKEKILLWDDYIGYINGKEVIVPIEQDGAVLGYIFRGVMER